MIYVTGIGLGKITFIFPFYGPISEIIGLKNNDGI